VTGAGFCGILAFVPGPCPGRSTLSTEPTLPNIKAAIKWTRQSEKRTQRNLDVKTRLKTLFKKATKGDESVSAVEAQFDKAARKGIIHPNKAARKKSRLAKAVTVASAQRAAVAAAPPKTRKASTKKTSAK
jgi:small subunit ribosomal protein S20